MSNTSLLEILAVDEPPRGESISLVARQEGAFIGLGDTLVSVTRMGQAEVTMQFHHEIRGMAASPHGTLLRLCVMFDDGALLFRGSVSKSAPTHRFQGSYQSPVGLILRDGHLILADVETWQVYDIREVTPQLTYEGTHGLSAPVALLRSSPPTHFSVLSERGPLVVFST